MPVTVAEYLGVRTDSGIPIMPIPVSKKRDGEKPILPCPFKNSHCDKAARGDKPVCSLRDSRSGSLWIVCSHRLCATSPKDSALNEHQKAILHSVAKTIFSPTIKADDVLFKREEPIKVTKKSNYMADYVMSRKNASYNSDRAVVLEMQGGGETSNTGILTRHIDQWEINGIPDNNLLCQSIKGVSPLVTNAWRRQQEQFLVKGNVAMLTGGRMVFCVGSMIYDYLIQRFRDGIIADLENANWTLALLTFVEDKTNTTTPPGCAPHSIPLRLDKERSMFTNYNSFVQVLTNQALPSPTLFTGEFTDLSGNKTVL